MQGGGESNKSALEHVLELLKGKNQKPVVIGLGLCFLAAFSGSNTIIYYASGVFAELGIANDNLLVYAVALPNIIGALLALYLTDRWGRRPLLLSSFAAMAASLTVLAVATMPEQQSSDTVNAICADIGVFSFVCWYVGMLVWDINSCWVVYLMDDMFCCERLTTMLCRRLASREKFHTQDVIHAVPLLVCSSKYIPYLYYLKHISAGLHFSFVFSFCVSFYVVLRVCGWDVCCCSHNVYHWVYVSSQTVNLIPCPHADTVVARDMKVTGLASTPYQTFYARESYLEDICFDLENTYEQFLEAPSPSATPDSNGKPTVPLPGLGPVSLPTAAALTCIPVYVCAFSAGAGPIPWLLYNEIFPTRVRI